MFRTTVEEMAQEEWQRGRAADLRGFAVGLLERHLERRIRSARALERG
jgi:DNA repair protein RecO (recombination protein O)